jgi:hypothetical protein
MAEASEGAKLKAKAIAEDFVAKKFREDGEAVAWLVEHIARALHQAERAGYEAAALSLRRDFPSDSPRW